MSNSNTTNSLTDQRTTETTPAGSRFDILSDD